MSRRPQNTKRRGGRNRPKSPAERRCENRRAYHSREDAEKELRRLDER